ncbi:uncharacterized protein [Phyllobates terribilis]|uniref:uncharacterized protein n=1 Tax=Phyllobates terribilis TaxID=111132 RepID=UPI003CCB07ED
MPVLVAPNVGFVPTRLHLSCFFLAIIQILSKEKRVAIITLRNEGQSVQKIGQTLKVSPSAVAKTIKRYKETGSDEDRPRKGRPRVTSASEDKFIRVTSLRNRRLTAAQIRDQVNATQSSSSRHISTTTVKRRHCAASLRGKISARKPLLRTGNKKGERMDSTCLVPTVKHGGGGMMVWGCFAGDTVGDLFKIEGILNQQGYHSILQRHAIPSGLRLVGPSFIFQQDNDPKHTSRLCKGYLTNEKSQGVLRQMTWPPQSPDLNPIEMADCSSHLQGGDGSLQIATAAGCIPAARASPSDGLCQGLVNCQTSLTRFSLSLFSLPASLSFFAFHASPSEPSVVAGFCSCLCFSQEQGCCKVNAFRASAPFFSPLYELRENPPSASIPRVRRCQTHEAGAQRAGPEEYLLPPVDEIWNIWDQSEPLPPKKQAASQTSQSDWRLGGISRFLSADLTRHYKTVISMYGYEGNTNGAMKLPQQEPAGPRGPSDNQSKPAVEET